MRDVLPTAGADAMAAPEFPRAGQALALADAPRSVDGEARRLTDAQQRFVVAYTSEEGSIGNASEAARRAGYSERSARELGRQLLDKAHVQEAIRQTNQQQISGQMATKAIALLGRVIDDESVSMKVRVDAARAILDRGGYSALPPTAPKRLSDKSMSEMTADELRETMRLARVEMDRAKIINHSPSVAEPSPSSGKGE